MDINKNLNIKAKKLAEFFGEVSDSLQSSRARDLFNSALEFLRPQHLSAGLRVARLNVTQVEVVVPSWKRNQTASGETDPGILTTAGVLGAQLLLRRLNQADLGNIEIEEIHLTRLSRLLSELRGRIEFSKLAQENFRAELKKKGAARLDLLMIFYDSFEKRMADLQINLLCKSVSSIAWKDSHESHSQ